MQRYYFFSTLSFLLLFSCQNKNEQISLLTKLLNNADGVVGTVMKDPSKYEIQILYTQIDRNKDNSPRFTSFEYKVDSDRYFYPASTVKLPVAIMALEKINSLGINELESNSRMEIDSAYSGQSSVLNDTTSESGFPSIEHYIKKILLVSDNDAFNRLYEFVGQKSINDSLKAKGLSGSKITHRLSIALSEEENRHTNPMRFYKGDELIYEQPLVYNSSPIAHSKEILKGKGEMSKGKLVNKPKDFSAKNSFPIADQHRLLKELFFPGSTGDKAIFHLTENDYQFLFQYMSQLPHETKYPAYDSEHYYDSYVKFFMYGDTQKPMPKHVRIFNKVGQAYGFLIDNAYVVDYETGVEFLLTAVISVNENQIFNDDNYQYDEIGFPFLSQLGRIIYNYELNRPKAIKADLGRFKVDYESRISGE